MSEKSQLTDRLLKNRVTREAYVRAKVTTNIPSQIKALRRRQGDMTQAQLAQEADMLQSRISAVEKPGARLSVDTLVRLAAAFRVGLLVKFVSLSEMVRWENSYSQDAFNATPIEDDFKLHHYLLRRGKTRLLPRVTTTINALHRPRS